MLSCATYKRSVEIERWMESYDIQYTVYEVNKYCRETDSLIETWKDTVIINWQHVGDPNWNGK